MKPIDPVRAELLALAQSEARSLGLTLVLVGAFARDTWLEHIHEIETGRATRDIDVTVAVESWDAFDGLKKALVDTGRFTADEHATHRLRSNAGIPLDIVPCDGVESAERLIT